MFGEIVVRDFDFQVRHLLDALQHFESAAAALAFQRIGGIGHELQLAQHKLRDQHDAIQKMGLANVRDAAVDDDAGVEHLGHSPRAAFAAEQPAEGREVEHVSLVCANHQADVRHHQKQSDVHERPRTLRDRCPRQDETHQVRAKNAQDRADRRPDQAAQAGALQANLKQKNGNGKRQANAGRHKIGQTEWMKMISGRNACDGENQPHHHVVPPVSEFRLGLCRCRGTKWERHRRRRRNGSSLPGKRTVHKASFLMRRQKNGSATPTQYLYVSIGADLGREV